MARKLRKHKPHCHHDWPSLTEWTVPESQLQTGYAMRHPEVRFERIAVICGKTRTVKCLPGHQTYLSWCIDEVKRLRRAGRDVKMQIRNVDDRGLLLCAVVEVKP